MPSIALQRHDVIVGVDTHKDEHIAVAIDGLGGLIDKPKLAAATPDGYAELLVWAQSLGEIHAFGVEGCGSYGSGLARFLRRHGHIVHEVARPPRKGERRLSGKSDPIDAEHAATVLSGSGTASDELRIELESLTDHKLIIVCAALETNGNMSDPHVATRYTLAHLAQRWLDLHQEIKVHGAQLKVLTKTAAPKMLEQFGVGFDTAAEVLIAAGDNTDRIRSEAAFAKLCGVCPIPAGSGKTSGRHRLNRGGNRQANAALYRVVVVRPAASIRNATSSSSFLATAREENVPVA